MAATIFSISVRSLIVAALITLASCQPSETMTERERQTVEAEVRQTLQSYNDTIQNEGLLGEFAYLDSTADFFWVPPGYGAALPYDSVAAILRANANAVRSIENTWDNLRVVPLSRKLASYTGKLKSTSTDTAGTVTTTSLVETGILIKRGAGWKLLCGQTAIVTP